VRTVQWSAKAERQLDAWIDHLVGVVDLETASRASEAARRTASNLGRFAAHRPSRWAGYREVSLRSWHKIIVYRVQPDRIIISAVYDMRQDLSRVQP
jgi:plasmid stabilization system protein ParE